MPTPSLHPYLSRLVREWDDVAPGALHRAIDGSMVMVDVSGFTSMSERLARHGKVGAEEVTEVIGSTFERLLAEAYAFGATLVKFGGDALLLFFRGEGHPQRACAAAHEMRHALRDIGVFQTTAGQVRLRMSVGVHTGSFDFFMVGDSHRELIVAGPAATATIMAEKVAGAGQIVITPTTAAELPKRAIGKSVETGFLLAGHVAAPRVDIDVAQPNPRLTQFVPLALREPLLAGAGRTGAPPGGGHLHLLHRLRQADPRRWSRSGGAGARSPGEDGPDRSRPAFGHLSRIGCGRRRRQDHPHFRCPPDHRVRC